MEEVEQKILQAIRTTGEIEETGAWAQSVGLQHNEVLDGALKRFASYDVLALTVCL